MKEVLKGNLESHKEFFRGNKKRKESTLIKRLKKFILKRKNA